MLVVRARNEFRIVIVPSTRTRTEPYTVHGVQHTCTGWVEEKKTFYVSRISTRTPRANVSALSGTYSANKTVLLGLSYLCTTCAVVRVLRRSDGQRAAGEISRVSKRLQKRHDVQLSYDTIRPIDFRINVPDRIVCRLFIYRTTAFTVNAEREVHDGNNRVRRNRTAVVIPFQNCRRRYRFCVAVRFS